MLFLDLPEIAAGWSGAPEALWAAVFSPGWLFTEGRTTARDLEEGWLPPLALGLSGLPVDESESWESCTVTQLMTLVR